MYIGAASGQLTGPSDDNILLGDSGVGGWMEEETEKRGYQLEEGQQEAFLRYPKSHVSHSPQSHSFHGLF